MTDLSFEAQKSCRIDGMRYRKGDTVHFQRPAGCDCDLIAALADSRHLGEGGPLGWGGFTSRGVRAFLRAHRCGTALKAEMVHA